MMFIEMASYVGDVLSFYVDNQFNNEVLAFSKEDSEKILGIDITELEDSIDYFYSKNEYILKNYDLKS